MFTGIVEATGDVVQHIHKDNCIELLIKPRLRFDDLSIGDSVAVNGVCLTITKLYNDQFSVDVVPETLQKTNLQHYVTGSAVNLERSMKLNNRIGGHYVQGHVDFAAEILSIRCESRRSRHCERSAAIQAGIENEETLKSGLPRFARNDGGSDEVVALIAEISCPIEFSRYLVNKGYITLDGMSITIIEASETKFSVTFIPHTQDVTIVKHYVQGTKVNVEVDIMGKYVEKILQGYKQ